MIKKIEIMKKFLIIVISLLFFVNLGFSQHVGDGGKTYYDKNKTKLKEVYNYKEVNVFSATGDHSIVEVIKKKHGPYFYYYESGKIKISGNYKNDEKHGEWKYFNAEGSLIKTEEYEKGKLINSKRPE